MLITNVPACIAIHVDIIAAKSTASEHIFLFYQVIAKLTPPVAQLVLLTTCFKLVNKFQGKLLENLAALKDMFGMARDWLDLVRFGLLLFNQ